MSKGVKKIEVVQVVFNSTLELAFIELLKHDKLIENEIWVKGKWISATILHDGRDYFVGLIVTTRSSNIPPKRNRRSRRTNALGLTQDEGLAYANVFLYDYKSKALFYEVNKFGCYMDHFIEYIYKCFEGDEEIGDFNIVFNPVLNRDQYQRILTMNLHKSIEVELANPRGIIEEFDSENNALFEMLKPASAMGSDKFNWKIEVSARSPRSLGNRTLRQILGQLRSLSQSRVGENVKKIIVRGYEQDPEDDGITTIDLIADRFITSITLDEPRENVDLLEEQRRVELIREYRRCKDEVWGILGYE